MQFSPELRNSYRIAFEDNNSWQDTRSMNYEKKVNENPKFNNDDPTWYFIAEFSLSEVAVDEIMAADLTVGSLFQTIRELGLPPECLKRIEETITEIARGANSPINPGVPDLPVRFCLYCNRKTTDSVYHSDDQMNGGWGYYVIERGKDLPNVPGQESCRVVELYLYKEGDWLER